MARELRDSTVVITGASSGIGRAAALAFADRGANLVLAARRGDALEQLARECEARGVRAVAIPTDVRNPDAVAWLAQRSIDEFGHIDTWVNNAAVSLFGRFEEVPGDLFTEVVYTNLYGYVYGAREALRRFREQGNGVLINVSSVVGEVGQPYTTAYTSTKWAIRALSDSIRMEVALDEAPDIAVCTVLPAAIDTPLFQQAGNYSGRVPRALDPVYEARRVAADIVSLAAKPRREVHSGNAGLAVAWARRLMPGVAERMMARTVDRKHFEDRPAPPTPGNIREPMPGWATVSGGWKQPGEGSLPASSVVGAVALPLVGLIAGGAALWQRRVERAKRPRGRLAWARGAR